MASDSKIGLVLGGLAVLVLIGGGVTAFLTTGGGEEVAEETTEEAPATAAVDEAEAPSADGVAEAGEEKDTGLAAILAGAEAAEDDAVEGTEAAGDAEPTAGTEAGAEPAAVGAAAADEGTPTEELSDEELIDVLAGAEESFSQAIGDGPAEDTGKPEAKKPAKKGQCRKDARVEKKAGVFHIPKSVLDTYAKNPGKAGELGSFWWAKGKKKKRRGVRLGKLPCPGIMRAAGFRRGDLIVAVNGKRPVSVASAVSIYGAARSKGSAEVVVRRGKKGQKRTVKMNYRFTEG